MYWEIICHAYIWTEIDLDSNVRNYYVNRQVRAVFRWHVSIQTRFEILKYLIKEKKPVYGLTGRLYVMPTYEQKFIWTQCKELLCYSNQVRQENGFLCRDYWWSGHDIVSLFSRSVLVAVNSVIIQDDDHTFFQIIKRVPVVPRTYIWK